MGYLRGEKQRTFDGRRVLSIVTSTGKKIEIEREKKGNEYTPKISPPEGHFIANGVVHFSENR